MSSQPVVCPNCGQVVSPYRNPTPTVDIVIEVDNRGIVLIERKNFPHGWALPGGFVDYGESLEQAAVREALEETSLSVELVGQLGAYSDPARDPRGHTITNVFLARASGNPKRGGTMRFGRKCSTPEACPLPWLLITPGFSATTFKGAG